MRRSREQTAHTREAIVAAAARRFRSRGIDATGVADLMAEAGLTHGGFYTHFGSKDELVAEVCGRALAGMAASMEAVANRPGTGEPLERLLGRYLSRTHRDNPGEGCPLPTLGPEMLRQSDEARAAFTAGLESTLALLSRLLPGETDSARRRRSLGLLALMTGALALSRAVSDPRLSDEMLDAARAAARELTAAGAAEPPPA